MTLIKVGDPLLHLVEVVVEVEVEVVVGSGDIGWWELLKSLPRFHSTEVGTESKPSNVWSHQRSTPTPTLPFSS